MATAQAASTARMGKLGSAAIWLSSIAVLGVLGAAYEPWLLVAAPAALAVLGLVAVRPEAATLLVVFVLYTNLADVAYQYHGVPKPLAAAVPLLLGVPLVVVLLVRRGRVLLDATFLWMLAFGLVLIPSSLMAKDAPAAVDWILVYLIEGLLLYVLVTNVVRESGTLHRVVSVLLLAGAVMGALTVFQEVTGTHDQEYFGLAQGGGLFSVEEGTGRIVRTRAAGPVGEQNRYAQILLVLIPLGLFRIRSERNPMRRAAVAAATALIAGGLVLTFSRGAFVALAMTAALMVLLGFLRLRRLLVVGLLGVLLAAQLSPSFFDRIASLGSVARLVAGKGGDVDRPVLNRLAENLTAAHVFLDHPLLGVGPGQFVLYTRQYADRLSLTRQDRRYRAHNLYLEIAAETGVFGLLAFLAMLGSAWMPLWRRARGLHASSEVGSMAAGFLFSLAAYLASGLFLHLAYPRYFFLLLALASAAGRLSLRDAAPAGPLLFEPRRNGIAAIDPREARTC